MTDEMPPGTPSTASGPTASGPTAASAPPGDRRLAHPPSDRYRAEEERRAAAAMSAGPAASASLARGLVVALIAAIVGTTGIVVLGGVLSVTSGLVVLAGATGWGVAAGLRFGAADRLPGVTRVVAAIVIAVTAVILGQLGLWQYARTEGGVLMPLDYLGEVFGLLVPLQLVAAGVVAWLVAR